MYEFPWVRIKTATFFRTAKSALALVTAPLILSRLRMISALASSWAISHVPTDLVVAQDASAVESSSRLDFLLLHNLGTSFVAP